MKSTSSLPSSTQSSQITFLNPHIIELSDKGFINSHIDSIKFSGNLIAGLSIGSTRVMTLKYDESSDNSTATSYRSSSSSGNSTKSKQTENIYYIGNKNVDDTGRNSSVSSVTMNDDLEISSIINKISDDKVKGDMTMIHSSLNNLIDNDYIINDHGFLYTNSCCSNENKSSSNNNNDNINHHHLHENNYNNINTSPTLSMEGQDCNYSPLHTIRRPFQVDLTLLPRSLYILTGCWRYHYSHAILPSAAKRTSIIFRDVKLS